MAGFELQFPASEINALAARYDYADDRELLALGAAARARGYYTRRELTEVCAWKTPRSRSLVASNARHAVTSRTRRSLTATDESERITPLLGLHCVGVPTASTLLYAAFSSDYPILDVRALESLGARSRSTYPVSFWLRHLDACRELARVHGVSVRTLDKALWQHSRERSAAPRRRRARHP
ncbi:MAG: hypothetical protein ACXVWJ_22115 [Solirubrobacteraceae bacterium]